MSTEKRYDVVVYGASGFTGRFVAQYLMRTYGLKGSLKWTIAGRSSSALKQVLTLLSEIDGSAELMEPIIAECHDEDAISMMVAQTKVVITTVGPYASYGETLVKWCATLGVHYCDLTGEAPFIHLMIEKYGTKAAESGAKIVNCCGLECIVSDLSALMVADEMAQQHGGAQCSDIKLIYGPMRGKPSGGTLNSILTFLSQPFHRVVLEIIKMRSPYYLYPATTTPTHKQPPQDNVTYDRDVSAFVGPWFLGTINRQCVLRTNALLGSKYGKELRVLEVQKYKGTAVGWLTAITMTILMNVFLLLLIIPPTRYLMRKVLYKPGEGPSKQDLDNGFLRATVIAKSEADATGKQHKVVGTVSIPRDAGYLETATMLSEAGVCLAQDAQSLPMCSGFITPAVAMGTTLLNRLRARGLQFSISSASGDNAAKAKAE